MALTTVADIKAYMGITVTTYDTLLATLLARAETLINSICNRELGFAYMGTIVERLNPNQADAAVLKYTPIDPDGETITLTIVRDGATVYTFQSSEFEVNYDTGAVRLLGCAWDGWAAYRDSWNGGGGRRYASSMWRPSFGVGLTSLNAAYSGGYQTIPGDLAQACIEIVKAMFNSRTIDGTFSEKKLGEHGWKLAGAASGGGGSSFGLAGQLQAIKETYLQKYMGGRQYVS